MKVYFLYGSRPAYGFRGQEHRVFGGIHGGHVTIGFDNLNVGFVPHHGFHVFAHRRNYKSIFFPEDIHKFLSDTIGAKYATFEIPLTDSQYLKLKKIEYNYLFVKTPYDYAFIGMRCASSTYDILSQIGIFEPKSRVVNIFSNFYPKKLRKKMFLLAKKNNYKVTVHNGRPSRKWERG